LRSFIFYGNCSGSQDIGSKQERNASIEEDPFAPFSVQQLSPQKTLEPRQPGSSVEFCTIRQSDNMIYARRGKAIGKQRIQLSRGDLMKLIFAWIETPKAQT
jgi:hypothetical protein